VLLGTGPFRNTRFSVVTPIFNTQLQLFRFEKNEIAHFWVFTWPAIKKKLITCDNGKGICDRKFGIVISKQVSFCEQVAFGLDPVNIDGGVALQPNGDGFVSSPESVKNDSLEPVEKAGLDELVRAGFEAVPVENEGLIGFEPEGNDGFDGLEPVEDEGLVALVRAGVDVLPVENEGFVGFEQVGNDGSDGLEAVKKDGFAGVAVEPVENEGLGALVRAGVEVVAVRFIPAIIGGGGVPKLRGLKIGLIGGRAFWALGIF
jgi:hypothetical protein